MYLANQSHRQCTVAQNIFLSLSQFCDLAFPTEKNVITKRGIRRINCNLRFYPQTTSQIFLLSTKYGDFMMIATVFSQAHHAYGADGVSR